MTAFVTIPARRAAELAEAAGVPDARRLLIDAAAAEVVKTYAKSLETFDHAGKRGVAREGTMTAIVWRRILKQNKADEVWLGGTIRLAGDDEPGGLAEMNVYDIGFGEKQLGPFIARHGTGAAVEAEPRPVVALKPPSPPAAPEPPIAAAAPTARAVQRKPDLSAIPAGAITVTVNEAMAVTGLGRTKINALMDDGRLERRKVDSRTLITVASIRALLGAEPLAA